MKKSVLCVAVAIFLLPMLGGAAETTFDLHSMSTQELVELRAQIDSVLLDKGELPFVELQRNDKGDDVLRLQQRLQALGYLDGRITGKYDNDTQKAMKQFEKAHDLTNDGIASIEDQRLMFSDSAAAKEIILPADTPKPDVITASSNAEYEILDYETYARNPEEYRLRKVLLKGRVEQVIGNRQDGYQLRFAVLNNTSNIIYVLGIHDPGFSILEGDRMNINAVLYDTVTYESVWGNSITIPACYADEIDLLS